MSRNVWSNMDIAGGIVAGAVKPSIVALSSPSYLTPNFVSVWGQNSPMGAILGGLPQTSNLFGTSFPAGVGALMGSFGYLQDDNRQKMSTIDALYRSLSMPPITRFSDFAATLQSSAPQTFLAGSVGFQPPVGLGSMAGLPEMLGTSGAWPSPFDSFPFENPTLLASGKLFSQFSIFGPLSGSLAAVGEQYGYPSTFVAARVLEDIAVGRAESQGRLQSLPDQGFSFDAVREAHRIEANDAGLEPEQRFFEYVKQLGFIFRHYVSAAGTKLEVINLEKAFTYLLLVATLVYTMQSATSQDIKGLTQHVDELAAIAVENRDLNRAELEIQKKLLRAVEAAQQAAADRNRELEAKPAYSFSHRTTLRSEPRKNAPRLLVAMKGIPVALAGQAQGKWILVRFVDDATGTAVGGWVLKKHVRCEGTRGP